MHVYNRVDYKITILFLNKVKVVQWCLTLCDPINCSLPGSSVHRIFQTRVLEWVAIPYSTHSPFRVKEADRSTR